MSERILIETKILQDVEVEVERRIQVVYVDVVDKIYWRVDSKRTDTNELIKKEFFNCNIIELQDYVDNVAISYSDLWAKTKAIEAMPTETFEQIRAKAQNYGVGFRITINR